MADKLNLKEIKELMDKMASTGLGELTIKDGDFELHMESGKGAPVCTGASVPASASAVSAPAAPARAEEEGTLVKSPIVGTFYASPAPDKPPFVQVGSKVKKGDVLFVIESMKLMNEIQSDCAGEVAEILVENAQGVEYNQPIMVIR